MVVMAVTFSSLSSSANNTFSRTDSFTYPSLHIDQPIF
jgi:hypothetical protein